MKEQTNARCNISLDDTLSVHWSNDIHFVEVSPISGNHDSYICIVYEVKEHQLVPIKSEGKNLLTAMMAFRKFVKELQKLKK